MLFTHSDRSPSAFRLTLKHYFFGVDRSETTMTYTSPSSSQSTTGKLLFSPRQAPLSCIMIQDKRNTVKHHEKAFISAQAHHSHPDRRPFHVSRSKIDAAPSRTTKMPSLVHIPVPLSCIMVQDIRSTVKHHKKAFVLTWTGVNKSWSRPAPAHLSGCRSRS